MKTREQIDQEISKHARRENTTTQKRMPIKMKDCMGNINMKVEFYVTDIKLFMVRVWICSILIGIAAKVMGCSVTFKGENN